jgi:hypothetical protein
MGARSRWRLRTARDGVLVSGILLLANHTARADEPAAVRLSVAACANEAFDIAAFTHTVAIELRADGVQSVDLSPDPAPHDPPPADAKALATITLVATPCTADARDVEITIEDAATSKTVRRRLSLGDVARPARPRAIALAVAELLRASWSELRLPDAPPPSIPVPPAVRLAAFEHAPAPPVAATVVAPPPPVAVPRPVPPPVPAVRLGAAIAARFFPSAGSTLLGPNVALSYGSAESIPLRVRLDASALFGTSYEPTGSVATSLVTGGAALVLAHASGPVDVEVGPRVEVGWGHVAGTAVTAGQPVAGGSEAVVTLSGIAAVRIALTPAFWASLDVGVGGVLVGIDSETPYGRSGGIGGAMAGVAVGLGRSF